jgi:hypothetical protein
MLFLVFCSAAYFVGGGPQVLSLDVVHTASERSYLRTQAMGTVILELGIISRNFEKFGVVSFWLLVCACASSVGLRLQLGNVCTCLLSLY